MPAGNDEFHLRDGTHTLGLVASASASVSDDHDSKAATIDEIETPLRFGSHTLRPSEGPRVWLGSGPASGGRQVLPRWYEYDSTAPWPEDDAHEFKGGLHGGPSRAISRVALRYLVGFLNSRGGTLYFGVSNGGLIRGVLLSLEAEDEMRLSMDKVKHNCIGPEGSWLFIGSPVLVPVVTRIPMESADDGGGMYRLLPRVFVVELPVFPSHSPSNLHYQISLRPPPGPK